MSDLFKQRRQILLGLGAVSGVSALGLFGQSVMANADLARSNRKGQPVFGGFSLIRDKIRSIRVVTSNVVYTLKYENGAWGLLESGGYPVRADRMASLSENLETLSWGDPRTRDPKKYDRIGLGDPDSDGLGALIELYLESGEPAGALISGRKAQQIYGRRPDEAQCWTLQGDLPPLYTRQSWLDLGIVDMLPEAIASVRLTDQYDQSILLERDPGGTLRDFRLGAPYQDLELSSRLIASGPALAMSRFRPIDVKPARALIGEAMYTHVTHTFDRLELQVTAYADPDGYFVTLRAIEAGLGAGLAESINAKAEGWAFRLDPFDWNEFTVPIEGLLARPAALLE